MAGRSQASNLTGMLTSIGDTIGEMGGAGHQYVDTFRRSMAPKVDTEDASSLKEYSLWARRNGYNDEANRYERMAIERQKVEASQAFKQANLKDAGIMRNIHGVDTTSFTDEQKAAVQKAYDLAEQRMNQRGADYEDGKGTEGSDMTNVLLAEDAAQLKLARDLQAHEITVQKEQDRLAEQAAKGQMMPASSLPEKEYENYQRAMNAAIGDAGKAAVNEAFKPQFDAHRKTVEAHAEATAIRDVGIVIAELARSDKNTRWLGFGDGPLSKWMEANPDLVTTAEQATMKILASDPEYIKADEAGRKEIASKEFKKYLKEVSAEFKKAEKGHRNDLEEQEAKDEANKTNVNRSWDRGREAGGVAYQRSLASFKSDLEKQGIPFTPEAQAVHDQEWDNANLNAGTRPEMEERGLSFNANQGIGLGNKL